jgi:hypothetical protein
MDPETKQLLLLCELSFAGTVWGYCRTLEARLLLLGRLMNMTHPRGALVEEDEPDVLSNGHAMTEMCDGDSIYK